MDDDRKDVAIIEASALLVTLIFIILSFYGSMYSQLLVYYLQRCAVSQQECTSLAPVVTPLSTLMSTLTPFAYAVGFFFVAAALLATIHLFLTGRPWISASVKFMEFIQFMEFLLFASGLVFLAFEFFSKAPWAGDVYGQALLIFCVVFMILLGLFYAYWHRRPASV